MRFRDPIDYSTPGPTTYSPQDIKKNKNTLVPIKEKTGVEISD